MDNNISALSPRTFDADLMYKIERIGQSKENSKEVLLEIAKYLGRGQALPIGVSEWLAQVFEGAINHPEVYTHPNDLQCDEGQALLSVLGLRTKNKPIKAESYDVYEFMNNMMEREGFNQTQAAKEAAKHYDINVSSAQKFYKEISDILKKAGLIPN